MRIAAASGLIVVLVGCGGSMSVSEYAEALERHAVEARDDFGVIDARMEAAEPTLEDARSALSEGVAIRARFQDAIRDLDPPDEMQVLHDRLVEVHGRMLDAHRGWADEALSAATVADVDRSPARDAYRTTSAEGLALCIEIQDTLDATAQRGVFADNDWIPATMKDVAQVAFGCE